MVYNPIFEEEKARESSLRSLKESITYRATREHLTAFGKQLVHFTKAHPVVTVLALGLFGLSLKPKSKR
jgi:hypothetical protein